MADQGPRDVATSLQELEVHDQWASGYRTPENQPFYEIAFDYVREVFGTPDDSPVLDAGCGTSTKTIHLARRGYHVVAVDFSHKIVEKAQQAVAEAKLSHLVRHEWADLTKLQFPDATFRRVLCWGVLMHVPDVAGAVKELARVAAPGGHIIISENNLSSLQAVALRTAKRVLRREKADVQLTPAGTERWEHSQAGRVMTRTANVDWLVAEFDRHGAGLETRRAGEFTQIFTVVKARPARLAIHAFNRVWFKSIRWAGPSLGNLLVFKKR